VRVAFFIAAAIAVIATGMVITRKKVMHALLYLVVSFLAAALVFYTLGAPFIAALEVIIYAGAIMVLFLFAVMLIDPRRSDEVTESEWLRLRSWIVPSLLVAVLLLELIYLLAAGGIPGSGSGSGPNDAAMQVKVVGIALFGPYLLGVELASILLLAGLVAAHSLTGGRDGEEGGETAAGPDVSLALDVSPSPEPPPSPEAGGRA
jgi:NADH-quinone oxidoreductase subunit J